MDSAKRMRQWLSDLFGSRYAKFLERELMQVRLESAKTIADLKQERDELIGKLLEVKGIPIVKQMVPLPQPSISNGQAFKTWARIQAEAIEENAKAEAEESTHGIQS